MSVDKTNEEPRSEDVEGLEDRVQSPHPLAAPLALALRGAVFPLRRELVVRVARENDASPTLLSLLSELPARELRSADDVLISLEAHDADDVIPPEPEAARGR